MGGSSCGLAGGRELSGRIMLGLCEGPCRPAAGEANFPVAPGAGGAVSFSSPSETPQTFQAYSPPVSRPLQWPTERAPPAPSTEAVVEKLRAEVQAQGAELERLRGEGERRWRLVLEVEREVFEKGRQLDELKAQGVAQASGADSAELESALVDFNLGPGSGSAGQDLIVRARSAMRTAEREANSLRTQLATLQGTLKARRAEADSQGEMVLQLLFQIASKKEVETDSTSSILTS